MKFRLADVQTAITQAIERHMAACYPALPPLVWRLDGRVLTGQSEIDSRNEVDAWASALGLVTTASDPGSLRVSGEVDGTRIVVWAIADREVWEAGDR